jgi:hypothetical protein
VDKTFWWIEYLISDFVTESSIGQLVHRGSKRFILVEANSMQEAVSIAQDRLGEYETITRAKLAEDVDEVILKD